MFLKMGRERSAVHDPFFDVPLFNYRNKTNNVS
jgi:hypothetical protein